MKIFIITLLFISSLLGFDFSISNSITSNARTVFIEFKQDKNINYEKIVAGKKEYAILKHPTDDSKLYALIPTSYYEKPSDKKLKILYHENSNEKVKNIFLKVQDAQYEKEVLEVQKSKVNPTSKAVKQRTAKEYNEAMAIYNTITKESYINSEFILPLSSKITSDFGKARVYNGSLKGYHSGTDFRAKVGTAIVASNDGIVVLAKDRFYSGGSVIIDHGGGVYTCYYHMSKFDVQKGDKVKKSQLLGLSGDTGRVTGPHLHFSARVGGVQVDPLQLITLLNQNLFKKNQN